MEPDSSAPGRSASAARETSNAADRPTSAMQPSTQARCSRSVSVSRRAVPFSSTSRTKSRRWMRCDTRTAFKASASAGGRNSASPAPAGSARQSPA